MKKMIAVLVGLMFLFSVSMVCGQTKVVDPTKPAVSAMGAPTKADTAKAKKVEKAKAKADAKVKKADAKVKKVDEVKK